MVSNINEMDLIPVHIGLFGHIDAGKTAIARCLTQIVSTAGLDKHHQSQERGITIDLGFTFFQLGKYMVTLVDAPGHADLIRSVVSATKIIDMAIVVIDASKGPQIQTGEHIIIIDLLQISHVLVLLNKSDLVNSSELEKRTQEVKELFRKTRYIDDLRIISVSAKNNHGFDDVRNLLLEYFDSHPIQRLIETYFEFPFDHHFSIKGKGTIITGTVLSGSTKIGEEITLLPMNQKYRIKSIQKWKKPVQNIQAGDRCGIAIGGLSPDAIHRGSFATNKPFIFQKGQIILVNVNMTEYFNQNCEFGQQITAIHNMSSMNAKIYPVDELIWENQEVYIPKLNTSIYKSFNAILWLEDNEYFKAADPILLMRLDLSPKRLRVMGLCHYIHSLSQPICFYKEKIKIGKVKNPLYSNKSAIVSNLAQSKEGAISMLNYKPEYPFIKIISPFGSKGNLEIEYDPKFFTKSNLQPHPMVDMEVVVRIYRPIILDPNKSYTI